MKKKTVIWNKGKKMPHSPEWERKRIEAIRESAKNRIYPKGYIRPRSYVQPMIDSLIKKKKENPRKYREISIRNLPKNCSGEKNGNWKGGITEKTRGIRSTSNYVKWRLGVLKRCDYTCQDCSSKENLEVHHILPVCETEEFIFEPANGVVLCQSCHKKIPTKRKNESLGKELVLIRIIPHRWQEYPTIGNWKIGKNGTILIFVSNMDDKNYEFLVAIHEFIESFLCNQKGIMQQQVDQFDISFEKIREDHPDIIGDQEPGDMISAPYHQEHSIATSIERQLAVALRVNWDEYEKKLSTI